MSAKLCKATWLCPESVCKLAVGCSSEQGAGALLCMCWLGITQAVQQVVPGVVPWAADSLVGAHPAMRTAVFCCAGASDLEALYGGTYSCMHAGVGQL